MTDEKIPDRSAEPALQASLDHGPKSKTASNSDEADHAAQPDTRVREPAVAVAPTTEESPSAEEAEEMTGVPATSKELSDM